MTTKKGTVKLRKFSIMYQDHKTVIIEAFHVASAAAQARKRRKALYGDNLNIVLTVTEI